MSGSNTPAGPTSGDSTFTSTGPVFGRFAFGAVPATIAGSTSPGPSTFASNGVTPYSGVNVLGQVLVKTVSFLGVYAGNPNGLVQGAAGSASNAPDMLFDYTNNYIWVCTTGGTATTAVWKKLIPA